MNVTAIQMDPIEARAKLLKYRNVLSSRHNKAVEDEFMSIKRAYEELAKGTPLIDPIAAIREQGWRPDGRPVLAIARADQTKCQFRLGRDGRTWRDGAYTGPYAPCEMAFQGYKDKSSLRSFRRYRSYLFTIPDVKVEPPRPPKEGHAMVPLVPAEAYPSRGLDLSKHFVLWEVESWDVSPPVDPMLLKPIGGNLYAVVHQWNLTEIERMVIAGTRRE